MLCEAGFLLFRPCDTVVLLLANSLADFSQSQAKTNSLFEASTPNTALLNHFISPI
jgi:hypothetical protein